MQQRKFKVDSHVLPSPHATQRAEFRLFKLQYHFLRKQKGCSAHLKATDRPQCGGSQGWCRPALTEELGRYLHPTHAFGDLNLTNPRVCWRTSGNSSGLPLSLLSSKTQMSLPPEPPLLASPSPPVAQLPTPLARATGRRMVRELRGHGGLNVFSVKTGAGSLRSAQDCLKFREGGFQPAAEESMACASATETLSKTRLKTSLHDLVSEPDFDSQLRSLRLFPRGHSRVLCVVTL